MCGFIAQTLTLPHISSLIVSSGFWYFQFFFLYYVICMIVHSNRVTTNKPLYIIQKLFISTMKQTVFKAKLEKFRYENFCIMWWNYYYFFFYIHGDK